MFSYLNFILNSTQLKGFGPSLNALLKGIVNIYTLPSLRKNVPLAYDTVTLDNIKNHFRKVKHFMFGYLEGLKPGAELDEALKKYKVAAKSHRRIGINE